MEHSPPPLFKQGPSAFARLLFFVVLALSLLFADTRFKALDAAREVIGTVLYPLQRIALAPRDAVVTVADLFVSTTKLRTENSALSARNLQLALQASQATELTTENDHLRALLHLTQRAAIQAVPAEVQYDSRDPFTQKVIIDKGIQADVQPGAPVVSEDGVIGQVTRVYPLQSEVTLITDKDQAVPVQILRTGVRSVIYGTANGDTLDLRFVPSSADVRVGDQLVTSGLDGIYPAGLPVAKVIAVDRQADTPFAHVICLPVTPVKGARQLLVLRYKTPMPPPPEDEPATPDSAAAKGAQQSKTSSTLATASGARAAKQSAQSQSKKQTARQAPAKNGGAHTTTAAQPGATAKEAHR